MVRAQAIFVLALMCDFVLATASFQPCKIPVARGPKGIKIYKIPAWNFPSTLKCSYPILKVCHYDRFLYTDIPLAHNLYTGFSQCPASGKRLVNNLKVTHKNPFLSGPASSYLPKGKKTGVFWFYCTKAKLAHCRAGMTIRIEVKQCK